ncbi:protein phosphatase 2C domain-containing protein [Butyrivibrio sp. VCB2001]|uniref:protein phosphatase 2C domain-containing protein n=1 Tax=Butyrivibrio sp. VCB2001 TaxID=1280667 RepID=UPI0004058CA4|nr:protein phosphatase 2C domain-containing protein [Butyrivibrio sp. VCB2001]
MIKCPYCMTDNPESESFCGECGRPLSSAGSSAQLQASEPLDSANVTSSIQIPQYENLDEFIIQPKAQIYSNYKFNLIYEDEFAKTLDMLSCDEAFTNDQIIQLIRRIAGIFAHINQAGFVVGSCNLSDFAIDDDYSLMKLIIRRPLLTPKSNAYEYECAEIYAPEVKNQDYDSVSQKSDVYLLAIIANKLLLKAKYGDLSLDMQLKMSYYQGLINDDKQILFLHYWFGSSLSMYPSKRYKCIEDSISSFDEYLKYASVGPDVATVVKSAKKTSIGSGKKLLMQEMQRDKGEWNEDALELVEKDNGLCAYLLADGISNCDVGSGYKASSIVKEVFIEYISTFDVGQGDAFSSISKVFLDIVQESNKRIAEEARRISDNLHGVMGSTIILLIIYQGNLYYYSLGDSILYLIRNNTITSLLIPDNVITDALISNTGNDLSNRSEALTQYVGGKYAIEGGPYNKKVECLPFVEGDCLLLASDGVIDYMANNLHDSLWDKEQILLRKIIKHNEDLKHTAELILRQGNANGGGDNMSLILIKGEKQ